MASSNRGQAATDAPESATSPTRASPAEKRSVSGGTPTGKRSVSGEAPTGKRSVSGGTPTGKRSVSGEAPTGGRCRPGRGAGELHRELQLGAEHPEHSLDAVLSEGGESPQVGAPDQHRVGAERERLEDVQSPSDAAVHDDGDPSSDRLDDLGEALERPDAALSARPPWFETTSPSTPCSRQSAASSAVTIPFSRIRIEVMSRRRFTTSQVSAG